MPKRMIAAIAALAFSAGAALAQEIKVGVVLPFIYRNCRYAPVVRGTGMRAV